MKQTSVRERQKFGETLKREGYSLSSFGGEGRGEEAL
jgi:hypothetical protein